MMGRQHCFRLRRGDDLLLSIRAYAEENAIAAAVPIACVGCVLSWRMRSADGITLHEGTERAEIVSLTGTISANGSHLHISLAREDLSVIGGHLTEGCIVNTTAEIVLLEIEKTTFTRRYDAETGYNELEIALDGRPMGGQG